MKIIKKREDKIENYEKFITRLIGKFIHAPVNEHTSYEPLEKRDITINAWFAGKVAGYEKTIYAYDYRDDTFYDEPQVVHKLLLCDGMAYVLSESGLELSELTQEEFIEMVAEHQIKEDRRNSLILPD